MDVQCFRSMIKPCAYDLACLLKVSHFGVCTHNIGCCVVHFFSFSLFLTSGFLNWLNYQIVLHLIIFPYILHALHSCINGMSVQCDHCVFLARSFSSVTYGIWIFFSCNRIELLFFLFYPFQALNTEKNLSLSGFSLSLYVSFSLDLSRQWSVCNKSFTFALEIDLTLSLWKIKTHETAWACARTAQFPTSRKIEYEMDKTEVENK